MNQQAGLKRYHSNQMSIQLGALWLFGTHAIKDRMDTVVDQYSDAAARFHQFGDEFGIDLINIRDKAARLIIREGKFISSPNRQDHDDLNKQWHDLTEEMIQLMHTGNITPDRERLRVFATEISEFRSNLLLES